MGCGHNEQRNATINYGIKEMFILPVLSEIGTNPNSANIYLQNPEISLIPKSLIISIDELTFVNKVLGVGE